VHKNCVVGFIIVYNIYKISLDTLNIENNNFICYNYFGGIDTMNEKVNIEKKMVDHNVLNYLRENTNLNPIDLLKIKKEVIIAKKNRDFYNKNEPNDLIEIDYTIAEQLEYQFRLTAFERSVEKLWLEHGDGLDLSEFAMNIIQQHINEQSHKRK